MNYEDLTEEKFDDMAEQLVSAWHTLELVLEEVDGPSLPNCTLEAIQRRKRQICSVLEQDENKKPQWPPVRKYKVGLTQRRVIEFITEIEVEAADEYEAEQLAFEQAREDGDQWQSSLDWEEAGEADEPRELDETTWQCTAA